MKFTRKCSGVDAFAMVLHTLDYCTWPSFKSNVHLKNNEKKNINEITIKLFKVVKKSPVPKPHIYKH